MRHGVELVSRPDWLGNTKTFAFILGSIAAQLYYPERNALSSRNEIELKRCTKNVFIEIFLFVSFDFHLVILPLQKTARYEMKSTNSYFCFHSQSVETLASIISFQRRGLAAIQNN